MRSVLALLEKRGGALLAAGRLSREVPSFQSPFACSAAVRMYASKSSKPVPKPPPPSKPKLISKLEEEIREESSYTPDEVVSKGPPKGWSIDQTDGDCHIILSAESKSGESVEISVLASDDNIEEVPVPEDEEEEEGASAGGDAEDEDAMGPIFEVPFTVNIIKTGSEDGLMFDCVTDGETFQIRKVLLERYGDLERMMEGGDGGGGGGESDEEGGGGDKDDAAALNDVPMEPYRGPVFDNLDPELQDEFYAYLEERNVNAELAQYLHALVFDKEQREYLGWLRRVKTFIESK